MILDGIYVCGSMFIRCMYSLNRMKVVLRNVVLLGTLRQHQKDRPHTKRQTKWKRKRCLLRNKRHCSFWRRHNRPGQQSMENCISADGMHVNYNGYVNTVSPRFAQSSNSAPGYSFVLKFLSLFRSLTFSSSFLLS